MTSFTRKLYKIAPADAVALRRQNLLDYRYGKNVTLAGFTPAAHGLGETFGKRETPPVLPAYACRAPNLGKPEAIVRAVDAFQARKEYAAHHKVPLSEVMVRTIGSQS